MRAYLIKKGYESIMGDPCIFKKILPSILSRCAVPILMMSRLLARIKKELTCSSLTCQTRTNRATGLALSEASDLPSLTRVKLATDLTASEASGRFNRERSERPSLSQASKASGRRAVRARREHWEEG